jgi:hypothetical protein
MATPLLVFFTNNHMELKIQPSTNDSFLHEIDLNYKIKMAMKLVVSIYAVVGVHHQRPHVIKNTTVNERFIPS